MKKIKSRAKKNIIKLLKNELLKNQEPFRVIIDGRSSSGKTKLLIDVIKEICEKFEKIVLICPTLKKNKTYQDEEFLFNDNILICDCDFDDVEQWIKI